MPELARPGPDDPSRFWRGYVVGLGVGFLIWAMILYGFAALVEAIRDFEILL